MIVSKLIGLMPVRNEAWILGFSARVALMWCDELVIRGHGCTDATFGIVSDLVADYTGRVHWIYDTEDTWNEMSHRQNMLNTARLHGATHVAIIDADEVLTANLALTMRHIATEASSHMVQLPLYNLRGSALRYHANGLWGNRIVSVAFKDDSALAWTGDKFHAREPVGKKLVGFQPVAQGEGGVLHYWGSSERRLAAKCALYKITERLRWPDKDVRQIEFTYNQWQRGSIGENPSGWTYNEVPDAWVAPYKDLMAKYLDVDAEPWQIAECQRLVAEHGRETFKGLDLFGVADRSVAP